MSPAETCGRCGEALDADQRYCLGCGLRLTARPLAPAEPSAQPPPPQGKLTSRLPRLPLPNPRQAAMLVLVALSVGIVGGRALQGVEPAPAQLALSTPPPRAAPEAGTPSAPEEGSVALSAPAGNAAPEVLPALPAPPAPAPPAPAAPAPVVEPPAPLEEEPAPAPAGDEAPPEEPPAQDEDEDDQAIEIEGTVVRVRPAAEGYVLASEQGDLIAVRAERLPEPGAKLEARVTKLANGTTRELKRAATGSNASAKLRGTVTFAIPELAAYVVSARGVSLLVRSEAGREQPALLDLVTVAVRIEPDPALPDVPARLVEESLTLDGEASGAVDLAGTVQAVDPVARVLALSADDLRESERDLFVSIPPELDLEPFEPGRALAATVEPQADGSYRLVAASPL